MAELYVDPVSGTDDNAGLSVDDISYPTKTLSAAISKNLYDSEVGAVVIDETLTIHVARPAERPSVSLLEYPVDLTDAEIDGGVEIVIEADGWNQDNYDDGRDPFGASDTAEKMDPEAVKTAIVPALILPAGAILRARGVEFNGLGTGAPGLSLEEGAHAELIYCTVADCGTAGVAVTAASAEIENCCLSSTGTGVVVLMRSEVNFRGYNRIVNSHDYGLFIAAYSVASVEPADNFSEVPMLEIRTTLARDEYTAVRVGLYSFLMLDMPKIPTFDTVPGFLRIVRDHEYDPDDYYGVTLESHATLCGARNVLFYDSKDEDEKDTVSTGKQILAAPRTGAVVID